MLVISRYLKLVRECGYQYNLRRHPELFTHFFLSARFFFTTPVINSGCHPLLNIDVEESCSTRQPLNMAIPPQGGFSHQPIGPLAPESKTLTTESHNSNHNKNTVKKKILCIWYQNTMYMV